MTRVAAVDCGTNTIRLLVTDLDVTTGGQRDLVRRSEIVRLGQGVDRSGQFAAEALERTFGVSEAYAAAISDAQVDRLRVVATSAARDARNGADFTEGMRQRFGVEAEVISGDEEARLAYSGAARGVCGAPELVVPELVIDVGGGSTEFVIELDDELSGQSLDIGSVRMTERFLASDPPTPDEVSRARTAIQAELDGLRVPIERAATLVGVAGTVMTIAAMALGLDEYDKSRLHRAWLPAVRLTAAVEQLTAMTVEQRRVLGFMAPGRADVIAGGGLIVTAVLDRLGLPGLLVSESDILDGIAWSQA